MQARKINSIVSLNECALSQTPPAVWQKIQSQVFGEVPTPIRGERGLPNESPKLPLEPRSHFRAGPAPALLRSPSGISAHWPRGPSLRPCCCGSQRCPSSASLVPPRPTFPPSSALWEKAAPFSSEGL